MHVSFSEISLQSSTGLKQPTQIGGGGDGGGGLGVGGGGDGGGGLGVGGGGEGPGGGGEGGGGDDGAGRTSLTWTSMADWASDFSSMVTFNNLLISSRGFASKAIAADSTWLSPPAVSVTTTVRITLPAVAVTVSEHVGKEHCSSVRKLASTDSAIAAYSSMVPSAFSTNVTFLADTTSMTAPGGNGGSEGGGGDGDGDGGEGDGGGGEGGGTLGGAGGAKGGASWPGKSGGGVEGSGGEGSGGDGGGGGEGDGGGGDGGVVDGGGGTGGGSEGDSSGSIGAGNGGGSIGGGGGGVIGEGGYGDGVSPTVGDGVGGLGGRDVDGDGSEVMTICGSVRTVMPSTPEAESLLPMVRPSNCSTAFAPKSTGTVIVNVTTMLRCCWSFTTIETRPPSPEKPPARAILVFRSAESILIRSFPATSVTVRTAPSGGDSGGDGDGSGKRMVTLFATKTL